MPLNFKHLDDFVCVIKNEIFLLGYFVNFFFYEIKEKIMSRTETWKLPFDDKFLWYQYGMHSLFLYDNILYEMQ